MKHKLIIFAIALIAVTFFPSCQKKNTAPTGDESVMINKERRDSTNQSNHTNDSLLNAINHDIDSVKEEIGNSKENIEGLIKSKKEMQSDIKTTFYISIGAFAFSLLAIVLLFVKINKKANLDDISLLRYEINNINKLCNKLEFYFKQNENSKGANSNGAIDYNSIMTTLKNRLSDLEAKVKTFEVINSKYSISDNMYVSNSRQVSKLEEKQESRNPTTLNKKVEYAQLNNESYFMDTLPSKQETCVYKIEYTGSNTGVFDLISLDKIQSSNGWQNVIDVEPTGDCTMEEANSFVTLSLGECIKMDDTTWKKTKNLKIKISK